MNGFLDGFAVLRAIGAQRQAFDAVAVEAGKAAHTLVARQIVAKGRTDASIRAVHAAIGEEAFTLILDAMRDAELRAIVTTLDPGRTQVKNASADWLRPHVARLLRGEAAPDPAPPQRVSAEKPARGVSGVRAKSAQTRRGDATETPVWKQR